MPVSRTFRPRNLILGMLLVGGLGSGCADRTELETGPGPVLLLGVDGMEWNVLLPLIRAGRMPNFARLMERGTFGEIESFVPTLSPVIWTTIATGKVHEKHGIHHFAMQRDNELTLFDSRDRKTKALWNIFTEAGRSVNSIGWWMTWPVEEIRGVMVAQTNTAAQLDTEGGRNIWKGSLVRGITHQVHPPERQNEMIDRLEKAERNLERLSEEIFGRFEHPFTNIDERLWNNCQWAFRADATYLDIALQLAKEGQPDLTLLYLGGPDVVGHRFWRYREPESYLDRPSAEQVANFSGVIDDYYTYVDRALGELLLAHRSDTNVILVSDHGMHAANLRIRYDPKTPRGNINSGEHRDAPPGIFIAAGPAIEKDEGASAPLLLERGQLRRICSVLDITPTLLAMFGLPIGEDMDGKIVTSFLASDVLDEGRVKSIPTHDSREFFERRGTLVDPGELERLQQLRDLGYLGDE